MIRCVWLMSSRSCICPSSMMWWTVWESCSVMKEWTSECWTPSDRSDTRVKDTEMKSSKQLVSWTYFWQCVCVFQLWESKVVQSKAVEGFIKDNNPSNFVLQLPSNYTQTLHKPTGVSCFWNHCQSLSPTMCVCVLLWGTVNYSAFTVLQPLNSDQFCWSSSVCFMASCFSIICSQCYSS